MLLALLLGAEFVNAQEKAELSQQALVQEGNSQIEFVGRLTPLQRKALTDLLTSE